MTGFERLCNGIARLNGERGPENFALRVSASPSATPAPPLPCPTCRKATSDSEPLIAEHARWAMTPVGQAGRPQGLWQMLCAIDMPAPPLHHPNDQLNPCLI